MDIGKLADKIWDEVENIIGNDSQKIKSVCLSVIEEIIFSMQENEQYEERNFFRELRDEIDRIN